MKTIAFIKLLATGISVKSPPELEMTKLGEDPSDFAGTPTEKQIRQILRAANKSMAHEKLFHDFHMFLPHCPTWLNFLGDFEEHKDCGGLYLLYMHQGYGVLTVKTGKKKVRFTVKTGDIVLSDDLMKHSYKTLSDSTNCVVFNVRTSKK